MKNYLNYLWTNPLKLLWLIGIWVFCIVVANYIFNVTSKDESIAKYLLLSFISSIFIIANYQPYKEWKDGL